MKRKTQKIT